MDIKELESKKLSDLRVIAQTLGIENAENLKKSEILNQLNNLSQQSESKESETNQESKVAKRGRKPSVKPTEETNLVSEKIEVTEVLKEENSSKYEQISDEFAIGFAEWSSFYKDKNRNSKLDMLHSKSKYDESYTTKELLEIYKKEKGL
jgi:hypothetical protein